MKRVFDGSYTVEAALIMALVFGAIISMLQWSFKLHDQTMGGLVLQEQIEIIRHQEKSDIREPIQVSGSFFSFYDYHMETEVLEGLQTVIKGRAYSKDWKLELEFTRFDPERFLRMYSYKADSPS